MKRWLFGIVAAAAGLLATAAHVNAQSPVTPGNPPKSAPAQGGQPASRLAQAAGAGQASGGNANLGSSYGSSTTLTPGGSITGVRAAIKCIYDVQLAAQADGLLQELLVEEGSAVEKGQLMLTIDERLANAELKVAEKEAEAAAAQANQDAQLRFSKKVAEVSEQEYKEILELVERRSASLQEARRKKLEAEKGVLGIEVAQVDHAKEILAAAVAKEKASAAKVQLELRKVTAPYDGIIVRRMRSQGEWVKAGEPVLRLVHMKEMRVEALVPVGGASVAHLQNASMRLQVQINGDTFERDCKVEYVSPVIELNTCRIWARVPNQLVAGGWMLRDGMDASIDIHLPTTQPVSTQAQPASK